jgi:hypothetical protein
VHASQENTNKYKRLKGTRMPVELIFVLMNNAEVVHTIGTEAVELWKCILLDELHAPDSVTSADVVVILRMFHYCAIAVLVLRPGYSHCLCQHLSLC